MQTVLDQRSQVFGVEAAEDAAELTQGAEQCQHARVAESESGGASARFASGHVRASKRLAAGAGRLSPRPLTLLETLAEASHSVHSPETNSRHHQSVR